MTRFLLTCAAALLLCPPFASAQSSPLVFAVDTESTFFDDCDPGTVCFVVWCGSLEGTLTMEYVGFDDVYDNYDVTGADWVLHRVICGGIDPVPEAMVGSGSFRIDRQFPPNQQLILTFDFPGGQSMTLDSGLVTPGSVFPQQIALTLVSIPDAVTVELCLDGYPRFVRGDADGNGAFQPIVDAIAILQYGFVFAAPAPPCLAAGDCDGDDALSPLVDALYALNFVFSPGSPPIPAPHPACGQDPDTTDLLGCDQSPCW